MEIMEQCHGDIHAGHFGIDRTLANKMIGMDLITELPRTPRGNQHILVISDYFTKWATAIPIPDKSTDTVSRAIVQHWILQYSCQI